VSSGIETGSGTLNHFLGLENKEGAMFAHKLSMYLKNDGALAFKHKIEADIIPLLRKQKGFLEQITFLYLNGREVHAFSLWESAEHAEAYNRGTYREVVRMLASVIEGAPVVRTYDVLNSTIPKSIAAVSV
jgi:heme-degrading monooxygenase HmoA